LAILATILGHTLNDPYGRFEGREGVDSGDNQSGVGDMLACTVRDLPGEQMAFRVVLPPARDTHGVDRRRFQYPVVVNASSLPPNSRCSGPSSP
jgi:hypothetical protein